MDYDGTLCSTRSAITSALGRVFDDRSLPRPAGAEILALVGSGITIAQTIHHLHPEAPKLAADEVHAMVAEYRAVYEDISAAHVALFPGVRETLHELRDIADIIIASNKGAAAVRASLERFDLAQIVSLIVADEGGRPLKPDPRMYSQRIALHFPWAMPDDALMVGDTEIDLQFARAAGIASCWAAYGYGCEARCAQAGFDHRLDAFSDLPAIVTDRASLTRAAASPSAP